MLPFAISVMKFFTSKKSKSCRRFPIPLVTKITRCCLFRNLHNLQVIKDELGDDFDIQHEELKGEIDKNSKDVNVSIIIEACVESSFQLWFQTLYMFPIFVGLSTNTYTYKNVVRILGIIISFLTTAYSMVFIR